MAEESSKAADLPSHSLDDEEEANEFLTAHSTTPPNTGAAEGGAEVDLDAAPVVPGFKTPHRYSFNLSADEYIAPDANYVLTHKDSFSHVSPTSASPESTHSPSSTQAAPIPEGSTKQPEVDLDAPHDEVAEVHDHSLPSLVHTSPSHIHTHIARESTHPHTHIYITHFGYDPRACPFTVVTSKLSFLPQLSWMHA